VLFSRGKLWSKAEQDEELKNNYYGAVWFHCDQTLVHIVDGSADSLVASAQSSMHVHYEWQ
jgi:hypothetical protein